ncbi:MAG: gamma-glutamylcyclotransferase [Bacteroidales bacterium]|nr:gamma-glutamylcyclotransferase [Bacteroidales bacterium]
MKCIVFTYGTLLDDTIRYDVLGYHTSVYPAYLCGFEIREISFGQVSYPVIVEVSNSKSVIKGRYFEIRKSDLIKLDLYETNAYERIRVKLDKSVEAWVYIKASGK